MSRLEQWGRGRVPVLCSVLIKSIAHVKRSLQAVLGWPQGQVGSDKQDRRPLYQEGLWRKTATWSREGLRTTRHPQEPTCPVLQSAPVGGHAGTFQQLNSKCGPAQSLSNWGFCLGSTGPPEGLGGSPPFPGGAAELASCPGAGPSLV